MNQIKYGRLTPPDYDLKKVTAPVALHYSDNDWLSAVKVYIIPLLFLLLLPPTVLII